MRVLVVVLLLFFNVAFALWMVFGEPPRSQVAAVPTTVPGIEPLVLWSEHIRRSGGQDSAPPMTSQRNQPEQPDLPATLLADVTPPRHPDSALLVEPEAAADARAPTTAEDRRESAVAAGCRAVGPYASRSRADNAAQLLSVDGMDANVVEESVVERRYWVYLPPFVSRSAALEGERELRAHGIEDIQVLAGDSKENGISLGLYREPAAAERRLAQLRELGYAPVMEAVERRRPYFWIEVPISDVTATSPAWWEALLSSGLRVESWPCGSPSAP